jgi:hypothetical protein
MIKEKGGQDGRIKPDQKNRYVKPPESEARKIYDTAVKEVPDRGS